MNEKDLKTLVEQLVGQMVGQIDTNSINEVTKQVATQIDGNDEFIEDITTVDIKKQLLVENPKDKDAYLDMKAKLLQD